MSVLLLFNGGVTATLAQPISDVSIGSWSSTGPNLYSTIDEVVPSDSDYIYATTTTTTELMMPAVVYPFGARVAISIRCASDSNDKVKIDLKQNGVIIPECSWTQKLTPTFLNYHFVLTEMQKDTLLSPIVYPISVLITSA